MSASRLEDMWEDREAAGSTEADACALMGELSNNSNPCWICRF